MEDKLKLAPDDSQRRDDDELKDKELDDLSGGTGGPGDGRVTPHH